MNRQRRTLLPSLTLIMSFCFHNADAEPSGKLDTHLELQGRHVYNSYESQGSEDQDAQGFLIRRARADFRGTAVDPDWNARLRANANSADGEIVLEYAYIGFPVAGGIKAQAGQIKPQFIREESVNAFHQLAVERSFLADYFTIDFAQGIELNNNLTKTTRAFVSLHDGSYSANTQFDDDRTELGIGGRAEYLPKGSWAQFTDFSSQSGDCLGCLFGVAMDYEIGADGDDDSRFPNILKCTADTSLEYRGFSLFAAACGQSFTTDGTNPEKDLETSLEGANQLGFVAQAGAFVLPDTLELFTRFEHIDFDGVYFRNKGRDLQKGSGSLEGDDHLDIITAGFNYHLPEVHAKLSLDTMFAMDPVPVSNTGDGFMETDRDNQLVIRTQIQWRF
jgi:hypothetical protein